MLFVERVVSCLCSACGCSCARSCGVWAVGVVTVLRVVPVVVCVMWAVWLYMRCGRSVVEVYTSGGRLLMYMVQAICVGRGVFCG